MNLKGPDDNPSLPFVCGKFVPGYTFGGDRATVEVALTDLPNQRTNTFCVDNNGLSGNASDRIHFNAPSQRLLGQRYAAAMINFYTDPFALYMGGFYSPAELMDPGLVDPVGDKGGDGYSNFLEYGFLTDPTKPEMTPPYGLTMVAVVDEGEFAAIHFRQRLDAEAPNYVVEVSPDLTEWTSNLDGPQVTEVVGTPIDNGDGTSTVTVRLLTNASAIVPVQFLRLSMSIPGS